MRPSKRSRRTSRDLRIEIWLGLGPDDVQGVAVVDPCVRHAVASVPLTSGDAGDLSAAVELPLIPERDHYLARAGRCSDRGDASRHRDRGPWSADPVGHRRRDRGRHSAQAGWWLIVVCGILLVSVVTTRTA
jgi:hypothetical protein